MRDRAPRNRYFIPLIATSAVVVFTIVVWSALETHEDRQIARIAEAESYAARSRLVQDVDRMLRAMRSVRSFWSRFGRIPRDQWATDADIELDHFVGVEMILWHDTENDVRYVRTPDQTGFDNRPTDEEWLTYQRVLENAPDGAGDYMLGPFTREDGRVTYEIFLIRTSGTGKVMLISVVDAAASLEHLLTDISPGYAISVYWDDTLLYTRGAPSREAEDVWRREGKIRNSFDVVWEVAHSPLEETVRSMRSPMDVAVLAAGLTIAALIGLLLFENDRANRRARHAMKAEQSVLVLNRELEDTVVQRTKQLADRSSDLETILFAMGHDLRDPLNAISLNTQVIVELGDLSENPTAIESLKSIDGSVQRMKSALNQLVSVAALSGDTINWQPVDISAVTRDVGQKLIADDPVPPTQLTIDEMPEAYGDPVLIRTLIANLLSNAMKYSSDRQRRDIVVGAEADGSSVQYFVRDNGIGLDEESAGAIFDAFQRLDNDTASTGLGLGLYIARRIVRRHGGEITVQSNPGDGATFYFSLGE